jgi:hypothetical protein
MISSATLLGIVISGGLLMVTTMTLVTGLLGARITGLETEQRATHDAVVDTGARLLSLETDLGKR